MGWSGAELELELELSTSELSGLAGFSTCDEDELSQPPGDECWPCKSGYVIVQKLVQLMLSSALPTRRQNSKRRA